MEHGERARSNMFGELPKSELATASLRPDWRYTPGPSRTGIACAPQP